MYETAFMAQLREEHPLGSADPDEFVQHLFEITEQYDRPYREIMERHNGNPSGVEFSNKQGTIWAFVLEDASEPGRYRVQNFDACGFLGHLVHKSLQAAVEDMIKSGYVNEDAGRLDKLSMSRSWAKGMEVTDLVRQLNANQISHYQFQKLFEEVSNKYGC